MIPLTLAEIADLTGGTLAGDPGVVVAGPAFVDSRYPEPGGLFVAVVGEHTDGHAYAAAALAGGGAAVLGSRPTTMPTVVVADPVEALGRLARALLDRLPATTVLALTGSQGKTGTKDYLAQVLAAAGPTVATRGNNNNELGVPLTVLRATPETRYLVLEMGARGLGHVGYLCEIAPPRVGAVLNIGTAHIGEFGHRGAIALAKGELVEALPADGVAVLNADDELTAAMADRVRARALFFGAEADVRWRDVVLDELGRPSFDLGYGGRWSTVRLSQLGPHQVLNATAAAAMALAVGLELDQVAAALTSATASSHWRMEPALRADGLLVVNDAYNANPASMVAALEALAAIGARSGRRTVAVLGEMKELGEESRAGHLSVGAAVARAGVDLLVTVGPEADAIAQGARETPGWQGVVLTTAGRADALVEVRNNVTAGDVVLVKASRGVALEHLVEGLLAGVDQSGEGATGR